MTHQPLAHRIHALHRDAYAGTPDAGSSCSAGCGTWPCATLRALDDAPAAPAGRDELRDRIAEALDECRTLIPTVQADAVLAVLPAEATADVRKLVKRLVAHAKGFQDVLDESDRAPWARLVRADIDELDTTLAVLPADTGQTAALSEDQRRMLDYALDLADDEAATDGSEITEDEQEALAELRRIATTPTRGDRSSALREAADELDSISGQFDAGDCTCGDCALCAWKEAAKHLRRMADEAQPAEEPSFAGGSYLTTEHETLGMIAARNGGVLLDWEIANPWVTDTTMALPAGLRVAIPTVGEAGRG